MDNRNSVPSSRQSSTAIVPQTAAQNANNTAYSVRTVPSLPPEPNPQGRNPRTQVISPPTALPLSGNGLIQSGQLPLSNSDPRGPAMQAGGSVSNPNGNDNINSINTGQQSSTQQAAAAQIGNSFLESYQRSLANSGPGPQPGAHGPLLGTSLPALQIWPHCRLEVPREQHMRINRIMELSEHSISIGQDEVCVIWFCWGSCCQELRLEVGINYR